MCHLFVRLLFFLSPCKLHWAQPSLRNSAVEKCYIIITIIFIIISIIIMIMIMIIMMMIIIIIIIIMMIMIMMMIIIITIIIIIIIIIIIRKAFSVYAAILRQVDLFKIHLSFLHGRRCRAIPIGWRSARSRRPSRQIELDSTRC